jgi:hypothetical protein
MIFRRSHMYYVNAYTSDEIYHHGILGQKWGVRRYQNEDGSLTDLGRKRLRYTENKKYKALKKNQERYDKLTSKYEKKAAKLEDRINEKQKLGVSAEDDIRKRLNLILKHNEATTIKYATDKKIKDITAEQLYDARKKDARKAIETGLAIGVGIPTIALNTLALPVAIATSGALSIAGVASWPAGGIASAALSQVNNSRGQLFKLNKEEKKQAIDESHGRYYYPAQK